MLQDLLSLGLEEEEKSCPLVRTLTRQQHVSILRHILCLVIFSTIHLGDGGGRNKSCHRPWREKQHLVTTAYPQSYIVVFYIHSLTKQKHLEQAKLLISYL